MGQFQAILRYLAVVIVLIIACHEIVITQGRQIKALKKNVATRTNQLVNGVSEDSNGDQVNAHRPTTPGNSPGIGHYRRSGEDNNKDLKTKVHDVALQSPPNVEYSLTQESSKTDFRPTIPNFNSGIGHETKA
ncbi:hypothetical protein K1719_015585 [Acacia pycnantha]|nr:hypothetical protein K1719_015585 [Acacia pycnantha]